MKPELIKAIAESLEIEVDIEEVMPTNGASTVAYWEKHGVIGSKPDITDSQTYARELRYEAEHRNTEKEESLEEGRRAEFDSYFD